MKHYLIRERMERILQEVQSYLKFTNSDAETATRVRRIADDVEETLYLVLEDDDR